MGEKVRDMITKSMYTAIHHDRNSNLMFLWYADGTRQAYKVKHRFFTPNFGEYNSVPCGMKDIYGKEMYECLTDSRTEADIRARHTGSFNHISEIDIDFRTRWLQNNYQEMEELRFNKDDINICYLDIEVSTRGKFPTAEKAEFPVNVVTVNFSKSSEYYTFALNRDIKEETKEKLLNHNCKYINCRTESELIDNLFRTIGSNNVDILTGWNCDGYDIPYLVNRASKLDIDIRKLSRLPDKFKQAYISKRDGTLKIAGTEVIDFLKLYKKFTFSERDNYKLDTIGEVEVGERKADLPDGYKSWINYWDDWVWYNYKDVELMTKIENKCRMFETTIGACSEARVPFGAIFESKKMLVGFILNFLHKKNIVMPPLKESEREWFPGAYVYSTPGYYELLVSYDYRSMYPSIMMGANISPETKVTYEIDAVIPEDELKNLVRSPWTANGKRQVFYRHDKPGIVPEVVKILFDGRTDFKLLMKKYERENNKLEASYYDMKQKTYKILGNSLYGLLGNPYFQLNDIDNSASITAFGRELIITTIKDLNNYFETELSKDKRYFDAFGEYPIIDKSLTGTYYNQDGDLCYNRMSHGDTDSFFVKYKDIYKPYKEKIDKEVVFYVFNKSNIITKKTFMWVDDESLIPSLDVDKKYVMYKDRSIKAFEYYCKEYCNDSWNSLPEDKKESAFIDGMYQCGDYRVILNRWSLTDYCRVLDAVLMEDKLAEIMQDFADYWNYYENTLFLKREKCIHKAIVTAKKKYICYTESNEDKKYHEKQFDVTGLEIIRSSTTPFARTRIKDLVESLLENKDKANMREQYLKVKGEFWEHIHTNNLYDISIPSGVKKEPPKWSEYINWPDEQRKAVDWRLRCASVWNHLIENDDILKEDTLEPIFEGSKVKFIKVAPNQYGISSIAYIGNNCPSRILEIFTPDWDTQWHSTFAKTMDRLYEAVGWGKNFENDERELMTQIF